MNYLPKFLNFSNYFANEVEVNKEKKVSKYELYFEQMYRILSWEDNMLTLMVFLVFNFIFWIIVHWKIKLIGLFFFTLLIMFIWDSYFETRNENFIELKYSEAFDKISLYLREIVLNLRITRKDSPSLFCIGVCLICLSMSIVARSISGYIITYLILLCIFFVPLGIKFVPEKYTDIIMHLIKWLINFKGVLAEEELIPFISGKDFGSKDTDLDSLLTDRTIDSLSNSLVSGIGAMPSHLDIADSQQDIEEEDLLPNQDVRGDLLYAPIDLSSDSDSENREINFESSQFDGDSSSEEEKLLCKDLQFHTDFTDNVSKKSAGLTGVLSNFVSAGGALVANMLKSTVPDASVEHENSSDSEFEIINHEDIK